MLHVAEMKSTNLYHVVLVRKSFIQNATCIDITIFPRGVEQR